MIIKNYIIETYVVVKESKISNHWSSAVLKKYKRNAVLGDLHKAYKISSNFELEKHRIMKNYLSFFSHTISFSLFLILVSKRANR